MRRVLQFRLGCDGLPFAMGRPLGLPRAARICPHCASPVVGGELHMLFECPHLQPLRLQFGHLFTHETDTMRFLGQADQKGVFYYVLCCLDEMSV